MSPRRGFLPRNRSLARGELNPVFNFPFSTGVLVQQTRQDKLSEQRSHLTWQINLLTEQKIVKLIEKYYPDRKLIVSQSF